MRKWLGILLLPGCLALNATPPVSAETVRVGIYHNPPLITQNGDGRATGFFADIVDYIAAEESWQIDYRFGTFQECVTRLEKNEIDMLCAIAPSVERQSKFDFSREWVINNWAQVYARKGSGIKSITDMRETRVSALEGDIHYQAFRRLAGEFGIECSFLEVDSYEEVLGSVSEAKVDAGIVNRFYGTEHAGKFGLVPTGVVFNPIRNHFGFPQGTRPELISAVDRHLADIKQSDDSIYQRAFDRHFTGYAGTDSWDLLWILACLGFLAFSGYLLLRIPRIRQALGMSKQVMSSASNNVLAASILLAFLAWSGDALMDLLWFNPDGNSYFALLLPTADPHELMTRTLFSWAIMLAGVVTSRMLSRLKKQQKATLRIRKNLDTTLDSIGDAVITTDREGLITRMNPKAEELTGWEEEEALNTPLAKVFNIVNAQTEEPVEDPVQKVLESGKIQGLANHTKLISKKDREYQIADSAAPVCRPADSEIIGVVLVFRDVTKEYRMREALREQKKLMDLTLTASSIGLCMSRDRTIVWANEAMEKMFRVGEKELRGKDARILYPDEKEYSRVEELLFEQAEEEGIAELDGKFIRGDGSIFPGEIRASFLDRSDRSKGVIVSLIDITKRKRMEEKLEEARNYIVNIFDSMPSVLIGVDPRGVVTQWNQKAARETGIPTEDAVGQPLEQAFPRLASGIGQIEKAVKTRKAQFRSKEEVEGESEARFEDMTVYPLISNGVDGAVIRIDDVTEKVRLEDIMIQSEKMLSIGGLAAGMAHEINNPLSGILQAADLIRDRLTNTELQANLRAAEETGISMSAFNAFLEKRNIPGILDRIDNSGHRAGKIVTNMLAFARGTTDDFGSLHDITELLDQTLDIAGTDYNLTEQYDFRKIKIIREYEEEVPDVPCDSGKLQQVFLNILKNGSEAMYSTEDTEGRPRPQFIIRVAHEADEGTVRVEIHDNGPGMDEETRKNAFMPFFTTKPPGSGTGLGLSVSYFIVVENHGGRLNVRSRPGQGATFIIRLPVERPT